MPSSPWIIEGFRKTLGVDLALANESVREGVMDGKLRLDESTKKVTELEKKNAFLEEQLAQHQKMAFLAEKTKSFDEKKTKFIMKNFQGEDLEFIKENFDYTVKMLEKKHTEALDVLKEDAISESAVKDNVDQELTTEQVAKNPYIDQLSRIL